MKEDVCRPMTRPMTGAEYLESLRDQREVWIYGQRVKDVTRHPAFRNQSRMVARMYDALHHPHTKAELTCKTDTGSGGYTHRFFKASHNVEEMVAARDAIAAWERIGFGWMGRSPGFMGAFTGMLGQNAEFFAPYQANARRWYAETQEKVLFCNHALTTPPVDRRLPPDEVEDVHLHVVKETDGGLILRGAKNITTNSMLSNYSVVASDGVRFIKKKAFALICIVPMNSANIKLICRPSYEMAAGLIGTPFDYPLSSRFDENDATFIFDHVFVPWENVLVYGDLAKCNTYMQATGFYHRGGLHSCTRLAVKLDLIAGLVMKAVEATGTDQFRGVQVNVGEILNWRHLLWALSDAMARTVTPHNGAVVPNLDYMMACRMMMTMAYPKVKEIVHNIVASGLIFQPSSSRDFQSPELRPYLDKYMSSSTDDAVERVKVMKMLWDAIGTEFAGRHELYERNNYGNHEVIRMHSLFEGRDNGTVDELRTFVETCMADYDLDGWSSPDLINSDDINFVAEDLGKNGHRLPDQAVAEDNLLAEHHQLLVEWNDTQTDYPADHCIHHLFEEQVERSPDHIATIFGDEQLTYRELNQRANQLAHHLQSLGVGPEVLVGICVERSLEMVVGVLGILKAGGVYVPLDPNYPLERLALMLTDAQPLVLLSESRLLDSLPHTSAKIVPLDTDWPTDQSRTNPMSTIQPEHLAYVIYTSGSTGRPKGVQITHQSLTNFLTAMQQRPGLTNQDVLVAVTTLSFDIAALELYLPLIVGAKLIIAPQDAVADGNRLQILLHDHQATVMQATPATWRLLLFAGWQNETKIKILCGGETLPNQLAKQLLALSHSVWNLYGPTETTIWSTIYQVTEVTDKPIPIGKGIANTSIYVLNQRLEPVPIGVVGDLYIGGASLARGYLNRPELTAEKFISSPFGEGRLYKTGDLARWRPDSAGEPVLEYLGRADDQIKLRGFRIELGEIEAVLNEHSAVEQALVDLKERATGDKQLVAYIKPTPQKVDAASAEEHVTLWQTLYDQTYSQHGAEEPTFNLAGWQSSYTGQPIAAEEMREWVAETVTRIMALKPQRVLEIGCGTGLLLARIAPHCESYTGTDFSETALNHTRQLCQQLEHLGHVTLRQGFADDFNGFEANQFDTIILNSVVQYFPDIKYLERVIGGALHVLKAGGFIFIGDVRHSDLLETFHTSVQLYQADDTLTAQLLKQRIQRHQGQEKELLLAPDFFLSFAQQHDPICHVQVQPKYGQAENELTKFRYDVILHVGHDTDLHSNVASQSKVALHSEIVWHDWHKLEPNLSAVERLFESAVAQPFGLRHVPNHHLQAERHAQAWLKDAEPTAIVAAYRQGLAQHPEAGISLNQLRQAALRQGWQVEVSWLNMTRDGDFDVAFSRSSQPIQFTKRRLGAERSKYAYMPAQKNLTAEYIPQWRAYLQDRLPDYMLPGAFVVLDTFPLTPNGKIDRRALPEPNSSDLGTSHESAAPQTPMEEMLARLWGEVLGLEQVGRHDNFIELGGHSLLASQLIARIRDTFQVDLSLRRLFETPTIAAVADFIDNTSHQKSSVQQMSKGMRFGEKQASTGENISLPNFVPVTDKTFLGEYIQTDNEQVSLAAENISAANPAPPTPLRLPPHLITLQSDGGRRPLFLIHPLAGLVFPYYELALHMGPDQPIYGLQSPGIAGEASPFIQIEDMAEHYLAAIRQVQPEGPYQLAGWSFGGKLALEMAQQLQKAEQSVALLAIIDTCLYSNKLATFWNSARLFLTSILPHLRPYISDYLHLRSAPSRPEQAEQHPSWFFSKLKARFQSSELKRLLQVFQANVRADSRYKPQRYAGRVTLFKTATKYRDLTWGWGDIAANGVALHQIPGHHMNLLRSPQVQVLAEKLSACLVQPDAL
ncbi:amino acid adenylation domain-containing protein [Chloroflexi bacterium TSY]|nr:amino acid adenylation domain-containing protein [Chloroflexi bacterium TSY]